MQCACQQTLDTVHAPPMLGGAGSLLAGLSGLVLPGLVLVTPFVLLGILLVVLVLGLLLAGLLARFLAGLLVGLLARLFLAGFVYAGLLTGFVLAVMFVVGGAFLLPLTGV